MLTHKQKPNRKRETEDEEKEIRDAEKGRERMVAEMVVQRCREGVNREMERRKRQ